MEQIGIKAVLLRTSVINNWEEPPCSDLPQLIDSIRKVKQSVNDYLTDLVNKEKGTGDKSHKSAENSDEDEEDIEDTISGFIKEATVSDETKKGSKRKVHGKVHKAKKRK